MQTLLQPYYFRTTTMHLLEWIHVPVLLCSCAPVLQCSNNNLHHSSTRFICISRYLRLSGTLRFRGAAESIANIIQVRKPLAFSGTLKPESFLLESAGNSYNSGAGAGRYSQPPPLGIISLMAFYANHHMAVKWDSASMIYYY